MHFTQQAGWIPTLQGAARAPVLSGVEGTPLTLQRSLTADKGPERLPRVLRAVVGWQSAAATCPQGSVLRAVDDSACWRHAPWALLSPPPGWQVSYPAQLPTRIQTGQAGG